jgi:hypothetical protein
MRLTACFPVMPTPLYSVRFQEPVTKLPRLLAEIGDDRALFPNSQALQCLASTAPVSFQSGQVIACGISATRCCELPFIYEPTSVTIVVRGPPPTDRSANYRVVDATSHAHRGLRSVKVDLAFR